MIEVVKEIPPAEFQQEQREEEEEELDIDNLEIDQAAKKKRKRKPKKKKPTAQTDPPSIPVSKFFTTYPIGEIQSYKVYSTPTQDDNLWRETDEEKRAQERMLDTEQYNDIRRAAEVHRQVRSYAMSKIKPGMSMIEICEMIENGTRTLVEENGLEAGV